MRERGKAKEHLFFHVTAKHNKVVILHSLLSFLSMYLNSKTQHTSETWERRDGITDPGTFRAVKTTTENEAKPDIERNRQHASKARDETWVCKRRYKKNLRTAYFFKSGGCPDLLMVSTPANSLQQNLETSDERHKRLEKLCKKRTRQKERSGAIPLPAFVYVSVCNR
jgi:hypothetical protein